MAIEEHQRRLGERLRDIRHQQGMTLQDVESASDGRWKAVVVGAYERGDRAISVPKLIELADFYGVPVSVLVRGPDRSPDEDPGAVAARLDLRALAEVDTPAADVLRRYVRDIQARRGDHNGRMLSLRRHDLRVVAIALDTTATQVIEILTADGLLADAPEGPGDRFEVVIRVDGREVSREAEVDPVDGTLRLVANGA